MEILQYKDLSTKGFEAEYKAVTGLISKDDFASAQVKKLQGVSLQSTQSQAASSQSSSLYSAKLSQTHTLLFKIVKHQGQPYALMLEVVDRNDWSSARFLNNSEMVEVDISSTELNSELALPKEEVRYLNPKSRSFHFLNKALSFDDQQLAIYREPLPLIIIGSAGSGKTMLALEKMKTLAGECLYVSLSPYLVSHSREIYYGGNYKNADQEMTFLSFNEFIETIRIPKCKPMDVYNFKQWCLKFQSKFGMDKLWEEFRGTLTGSSIETPFLSKAEYLALGVKQSLFLDGEREKVYELFTKYLDHLKDKGFYDSNIVAQSYLQAVRPEYDHVIVDEVQDLTNVQIKLLLNALKVPDRFVFCGDSNQIVHPNFFSWSKVKSLLYQASGSQESPRDLLFILTANYRNSQNVTDIANNVLRIKQKQFGSIDKESNYLVESTSANTGEIYFVKAKAQDEIAKLNQMSKRSTKYAVVVLNEESKQAAKKFFDNPLVFSIHEAKGLEYENIILFNIVSSASDKFAEIAAGLSPDDLQGDLKYARSKDKTDKRTEAYKFYINAFYVAITRSIENLYIVEEHITNNFLGLLNLQQYDKKLVAQKESVSSLDEWQREASKLQSQGKIEQAQSIRENILHEKQVPWPVLDEASYQALKKRIMDGGATTGAEPTKADKFLLFEASMLYHRHDVVKYFASQQFKAALHLESSNQVIMQKYFETYMFKMTTYVVELVRSYGLELRNQFNQTPLMAATLCGNSQTVKWLVDQGADRNATDNNGPTSVQNFLSTFFLKPRYNETHSTQVYQALADSLSLKIDDQLVKLEPHRMEYFLYNAFVGTLVNGYLYSSGFPAFYGFSAEAVSACVANISEGIVYAQRKRRQYISYLLARHERGRAGDYNKKLFIRVRRGFYVLNPAIEVRVKDEWRNLYDMLRVDLSADLPWGSFRAWLVNIIRERQNEWQNRDVGEVDESEMRGGWIREKQGSELVES